MDEALVGYEDKDEIVFSVYFVNGQAATFTLKRKEDIGFIGEEFYTLSVSEHDKVLITRSQVAYTRTQHVTRRRKAPVPGA